MKKRKPEGKFEFIKTIVIAGALALGFRSLFFEPFNIPSGSMIPTLLVGDYLFVSKYSYGYSRYSFPLGIAPFDGRFFEEPPERGDVAVFRQPQNESVAFIKRIVGLPGDRIQVVDGVLRINDVAVNAGDAVEFLILRCNKYSSIFTCNDSCIGRCLTSWVIEEICHKVEIQISVHVIVTECGGMACTDKIKSIAFC